MPQSLAANKLQHISHVEISQEGGRPDPRLWRLLGHMSVFDKVHQWRIEHAEQIRVAEIAQNNAAQTVQAKRPIYHSNLTSANSIPKLRTLADFQAAIRAHLEADKETTFSIEEILSDDDSEDEDDFDEISSEESDCESEWSDEEDPMIEFIEKGTGTLLRRDARDDVVVYRTISEHAHEHEELR
jgi:hypothetical protein